MHQTAIHFAPVVECFAVHYLHRNVLEVLLIARLRNLRNNLFAVNVLLQGEQYLAWVDGFDEVIGYFRADGLFHDVLFFALGAHHHGRGRLYFLDALQRFEPRKAGHHLVEHDKVEVALLALV